MKSRKSARRAIFTTATEASHRKRSVRQVERTGKKKRHNEMAHLDWAKRLSKGGGGGRLEYKWTTEKQRKEPAVAETGYRVTSPEILQKRKKDIENPAVLQSIKQLRVRVQNGLMEAIVDIEAMDIEPRADMSDSLSPIISRRSIG